ncbi:hypothetical protein Pla163_17890 [Planctomycetes bacterium Pla163]|uniref:DUF72 domain-containing protein n=1 Tax=Rohdeia mirabilis TaxID=2528008 RepID=A0A518CZN1_9BACT|nr:hypothetical protein Pla163_17890 [Planctomycetes bacterium Pla163]
MEFGRIDGSVDTVDFSLPLEPQGNARVLERAAQVSRTDAGPVVRVGLAGWGHRDFVGTLLPPGTRQADFLGLHARAFTTNELNTTYYGIDADRIARWARATPSTFRFCPKLPADVTHGAALVGVDARMEQFVDLARGLGPRVGRVWGLLPIEFDPGRFAALEAFVRTWAARVPLAFELRHQAWFARGGAQLDRVGALFEEHDVALVISDVAGRRDVAHLRLTARDTIVRFVGNRPHPTDAPRIDAWVERLASWAASGLHTAHVFLHQRHDPEAVETARRFRAAYRARTGVDVLPGFPSPAEGAGPVQRELF